jgi:hypothetical protein
MNRGARDEGAKLGLMVVILYNGHGNVHRLGGSVYFLVWAWKWTNNEPSHIETNRNKQRYLN